MDKDLKETPDAFKGLNTSEKEFEKDRFRPVGPIFGPKWFYIFDAKEDTISIGMNSLTPLVEICREMNRVCKSWSERQAKRMDS